MNSLPCYAINLALIVICSGVLAAASSQTKITRRASTGSVSGRVTIHGKGKGGIAVVLRRNEFGPQYGPLLKATTDADGNYRIADAPAGNYQVMPAALSFNVPELASFASRGGGKALVLAEGENVEGIDFALTRGGVITGKVTRKDGRPVIEELVIVEFADQAEQGGPPRQFNSHFQTDDRGIYRIFGLPAGRYLVSVGNEDFFGSATPGRQTYERVFYPDVTNPKEAKIIDLGEGAEVTNIDIVVGDSIRGFAASGLVVDTETNQPLPNTPFELERTQDGHSPVTGTSSMSNDRGEFRFENITTGKYAIYIYPRQSSDMRSEAVNFEVVDQDVTGLLVKAYKGATLSGTVVLEGNVDKTVIAKLNQLRLQAYVRGDGQTSGFGYGQGSQINPDGSFRVAGLQPGIVNFVFGSQNRSALTGFVISRIERDGVVPSDGLRIKAGEQISGLKIFVNYGSGIVRGVVKFENGPRPPGARFTVWLIKSGENLSNIRPQEVDSRGHFLIEGVAAGPYDLHVNGFAPGARANLSAKQSIVVSDGEVTEAALVIDLRAEDRQPPKL